MALVDSLLKLVSAQSADVLVIPSAEPPWLDRRGETRQLSMPALGRDMVEAMVEELVEPADHERLTAGETVEARYQAEGGEVYQVLAELRSDGPRLTLRRTAAPSGARSSTSSPSAPPSPTPSSTFPAAPADPTASPGPPPPESASTPAAANQAPPIVAVDPPPLESLGPQPVLEGGPLASLLAHAEQQRASDVLLSHGSTPRLRVAGAIVELGHEPVDEDVLRAFIAPAFGTRAQHELRHTGSADLALLVRLGGTVRRYRANLFLQASGLALALRPVRSDPPTLELLNLPPELSALANLPHGLVLMTGTAGSGKSTTLVALIEQLNRTAAKHVITLEDPIEYQYVHRRALVHQRQLGVHVSSFSDGLRAALRESPDVILVGEMRDHATISAALTAAETGHLVLSTLHAADAAMALDRIIDTYPEHQQAQVRFQLAGALRAIVTQRLLPSRSTSERVPAVELLRVNTAVATKIREGRSHQILSEIQKGRADGMLSFEASMARLVQRGLLSTQVAMEQAPNRELMAQHIGRG